MPELPEVETVARGLRPWVGQRLNSLDIFDAKVWFESEGGPERLFGLRLLEVARRGKYLLLRFENGLTLTQHLRMTGKMLEAGSELVPLEARENLGASRGKALQVRCRFRFENSELWFFDTRRFGTLTLIENEEAYFQKKGIAPDPIHEPDRAYAWFAEKLAGTAKPAKAALLDQAVVAGVGNIYADEALHAAGIHPQTPAWKIREPRLLWKQILRLLARSIRMGGTTIRDYVSAEGMEGRFARLLLVYDRNGEGCKSCGSEVKRIVLAGRSTHFCPKCQPKGKSGRSRGARHAGSSRRRMER
ncbi:MAG TPA: bifunctional DNA-formamidopyrimidine glycosylase/DNA-(apurinic or apyrimidinic site) lyase [Bdellovibrionota bacterium]|jgi:formamidopyrimidine-DNA glycosylase